MQQGVYTPRAAKIRLVMLAAFIGFGAWAYWASDWNPFVRAICGGVAAVLLLGVPFMLKDLFEATRHARIQREEMERAYTLSGRHDTGMKPWQGKGDAPDNWQ